ncbi:hypothetical protein [Rubellimicrobium roseum]|uniref:VanZ family protein n=1 Tax=Rubellimicrobium roseum TaxID=687525 RepID=A0A5C4NGP8_9RHOB|nr:hypothetical protein [Rubellimicrobium roseum]TNC72588.1 hypothetical protein FHG71_07910 [Rubellimicrobium roseum]
MSAAPIASTRPLPGALIDARLWLTLSWAGAVVFAAALATLALLGRWDEVLIATCFFVPMLVVKVLPHGLPNLFVAVMTACFLISAGGWAWDWYGRFWWFDVLLHLVNPLVIMAGSMFMLWKAELLAHAPCKGRFVLWSTVIGLGLGAAWEVFEYTYLPLTWPDTILDLVMDTAGAALGGWLAIWLIEQRGLPPEGHRRLSRLRIWALRGRVPAPVRR